MKKAQFTIFACLLMTSANTYAQTPEKKSTALVHKLTATWCGPCGSWGWDMANEIITQTAGKALYIGLFVGNPGNSNDLFKNATADALNVQFAGTSTGIPAFGANGIDNTGPHSTGTGINTSAVKTDIYSAVNTFSAAVPVASPAGIISISGNTVSVITKTKFWSAANGAYYLAAYLIEDGALNVQNGQSGTVAHHDVLRGSMSVNKPWGEELANGSVSANQTYDKTFNFTVTDTKWDKSKLKAYTVIWKKNGTKYELVNASETTKGATGIEDLANVENFIMSPNPSNGNDVSLMLTAKKASAMKMIVYDAVGRSVYTSNNIVVIPGNNHFTIPTQDLTTGIYNVILYSENGRMTQRLSVVK